MSFEDAHTSNDDADYNNYISELLGCDLWADQTLEQWAFSQLRSLDLPDARLKQRCLKIFMNMAEKPQDSINRAHHDWAGAKGAYRFVENERVTPEALQNPIGQAAARACASYDTILAVQDTTTLSFESARQAQGLGTVNDSSTGRGMFYHPVLALSEDGLPLGLLDQKTWCRETEIKHKAKDRRKRPILDKESAKWLQGVAAVHLALKTNLPEKERPRVIHVFDREGDVHEVFELIDQLGDGAVIRSAHNRRVRAEDGQNGYARDLVRQAPLLGNTIIDVPRKPGEKKRKAELQIRARPVTVTPNNQRHPDRRPVSLTMVELWEAEPPGKAAPIHWLLWTTEAVHDLADALWILNIYLKRWKIEEFFFALKQGCRVEKLQFETAERLAKAVALYAPIALRILQCRDLARMAPEAPCTIILSEDEWKVLWLKIHKKPPLKDQAPPTIEQATLWIGRLGGHLNRKSDGMPGLKTLWLGFRDLAIMADIYSMTKQ